MKKINSRRKGNNAERDVIKILKAHFPGLWERKPMGIPGPDILAPPDFPYAIEVKHDKRIKAIHLFKGHHALRKFYGQAFKQAYKLDKKPLLIVKVEGWFFASTEPAEWTPLHAWCLSMKENQKSLSLKSQTTPDLIPEDNVATDQVLQASIL